MRDDAWMSKLEQEERQQHEAIHAFADYVKVVGLEYALFKVLNELHDRRIVAWAKRDSDTDAQDNQEW
jgi:hypothetical protein